jgi:hypothetical protein
MAIKPHFKGATEETVAYANIENNYKQNYGK